MLNEANYSLLTTLLEAQAWPAQLNVTLPTIHFDLIISVIGLHQRALK